MELKWSPRDKGIARRAYDQALANARKEILAHHKNHPVASIDELWDLEQQIREWRKDLQSIFTYSYSRLAYIFGIVIRRGWLHLDDLSGLSEPILERIRKMVKA